LTNEELTIHLTTLASSTAEQTRMLERIDQKVTATNGRVRSLELWQARLKGAWAAAVIVGPAMGAIAAHAFGIG
jgi:hypothetical protein